MATQLSLYNEALRLCGERKLASLTENREPRRLLDQVWDEGALEYCLEMGAWNFANRSLLLQEDPTFTTQFGYRYAFEKPSDVVRLTAVCSDEYYNMPLTRYKEEGGYYFSDLDIIYIQYVSSDAEFGMDTSLYPRTYEKFVAAFMASEIIDRLTQNETLWDKVFKVMQKRLRTARSKDAMDEATKFMPTGRWVNARRGGWYGRDRGNRGSLIG